MQDAVGLGQAVEDLLRHPPIVPGGQPVAIGMEAARERLVGAIDLAVDVSRPTPSDQK